jgi:hypothetical protein
MLAAGVDLFSIIFLSLIINLRNKSTALPEKIVFRVGKKAVANRQALLQFLVAGWLV